MPAPDLNQIARRGPRPWIIAGVAVWILALAVGMKILVSYELRPGAAGEAPPSWPVTAAVPRDGTRPTLVLFVHPQCPCSSATVTELAQILSTLPNRVSPVVFVYAPADAADAWSQAKLIQTIRALPGINVQPDVDGKMSKHFGAFTSGQAMLFDRAGQLQFSGGITGARGREGANAGRQAVLARIEGRESGLIKTPVFGCSLLDEPLAPEDKS
jgi:hypothetical protein